MIFFTSNCEQDWTLSGSADLGPAVFDVVQCQIQLIGMGLRAAVLPSVVRENRLYYYVPLFLQTMYNG
jgi:hypothetical protein